MPLLAPNLDDLTFQAIVDHARRLIPRYCPEWTDHNVSDPGITLIELFASMTEMLLYRVNKVPDKMYITFLELIGLRLEPPQAACAPITFYLSGALPDDVTIRAGAEVATMRTETNPPTIFTTETDLVIRAPTLLQTFTHASASDSWEPHDPAQINLLGENIALFPDPPAPDDAFYLALERDHTNHIIALRIECDLAGGGGVDPDNPPIEWQVWQSEAVGWKSCDKELDSTRGFNTNGEVVLYLPAMAPREIEGLTAYWLRCRLTQAQAQAGGYEISPRLKRLVVEARGGTVSARHAISVRNEMIGRSDDTPNQTFKLTHAPILPLISERDYLIVEPQDGPAERWVRVEHFADSGADDCHFTLDTNDGTLALGPRLPQPDGTVYSFGAVPPSGSVLRFSHYQYGGGVVGNVAKGTISVMKSSYPYVARVSNRDQAVGGRNAQLLDDAKLRAPKVLGVRTRAVTADDYEILACQTPGVARAHCLAPGAQPGAPGDPRPGEVVVLVVPALDVRARPIEPQQLLLSPALREDVLRDLRKRSLIGTTVEVREPRYLIITVEANVRIHERSDPLLRIEVLRKIEQNLYTYLNPYVGGPRGEGWPFGRALQVAEIYSLLQRIPEIEVINSLEVQFSELGSRGAPRPAPSHLEVPPGSLICSGTHRITVR